MNQRMAIRLSPELIAGLARASSEWTKVVAAVRPIVAHYERTVRIISDAVRGFEAAGGFTEIAAGIERLALHHNETVALMRTRAEPMARHGWSVPAGFLGVSDYDRLIRTPDDQLDSAYAALYGSGPESSAADLWLEIHAAAQLRAHRALIEEAFEAFERGSYRLVGTALYVLFETALRAVLGDHHIYKTKIRNSAFDALERRTESREMERAMITSLRAVANTVYDNYVPGDVNEPRAPNRHFALHGVRPRESRLDCLKLLQAIAVLLELHEVSARTTDVPTEREQSSTATINVEASSSARPTPTSPRD